MVMTSDGTVSKTADGVELRFERTFTQAIDQVWAALTEPSKLDGWLSTGGAVLEPNVGGQVTFPTGGGFTIKGTIQECDPPKRLAYSWGNDEWPGGLVSWDLSEAGTGTQLVFTQKERLLPDAQLAMAMAGWHQLHDMLAEALAGRPQQWDMGAWAPIHEHYKEVLGVSDADAPSW